MMSYFHILNNSVKYDWASAIAKRIFGIVMEQNMTQSLLLRSTEPSHSQFIKSLNQNKGLFNSYTPKTSEVIIVSKSMTLQEVD